MLKKTLAICTLALCALMGLQAFEQEIPSSDLIEISKEEQQTLARCRKCRDKRHVILTCEEKEETLAGCKKCREKGGLFDEKDEQATLVCDEKDNQETLAGCKKCKDGKAVFSEEKEEQVFACDEKDLTPGVLVCNSTEDQCTKDGDKEETASSLLFAIFCEDGQDEKNLLACKECL